MKRGDTIKSKYFSKTRRAMRKCWREISFKDKGLIVIMIILILQCIHNLYNVDPTNTNYIAINIVIRTSVAAIFGYFLSSNFLSKNKYNDDIESSDNKLEALEEILKNEKIRKEIECEYNNIIEYKNSKEVKEEEEKYICNRYLQNLVAVILCVIIIVTFVVGVNFKLINEGSIATISQFRDLISGCIGFLIGNSSDEGDQVKK